MFLTDPAGSLHRADGRRDGDGIGLLDLFLEEFHEHITITDAERMAADSHLAILATILSKDIGGNVYVTGSIIQGDAMTPLTDIDIGIVVDTCDPMRKLQRNGPAKLVEGACKVLQASLSEEFPYVIATAEGRRRSILVEFGPKGNHPIPADFTADIILALNHEDGRGILIPNLQEKAWDRSDPRTHIQLIRAAANTSNQSFVKIVRLVKRWSQHHGTPLYSWNIKALALNCVARPLPLTSGLQRFFHYATESISAELTPDPAGLSQRIRLGLPRNQVIMYLDTARATTDRAIEDAEAGRYTEAIHALRSLFDYEI